MESNSQNDYTTKKKKRITPLTQQDEVASNIVKRENENYDQVITSP